MTTTAAMTAKATKIPTATATGTTTKEDEDRRGVRRVRSRRRTNRRGGEVTVDENKPLHPKILAKSPNWTAPRPVIGSFLKSALRLPSEAGSEAESPPFVPRALLPLRPVPGGVPPPRVHGPALLAFIAYVP